MILLIAKITSRGIKRAVCVRLHGVALTATMSFLFVGCVPSDAMVPIDVDPTGLLPTMGMNVDDSGDRDGLAGPPISRERSPVLDQALAANSSAALIMFLIEHPGDPFVEQARSYLRARPLPDTDVALRAAAGAQAPVVAAFDAARRMGTDMAWTDFLAKYGTHQLAVEVSHFR